jgi:TRAP-type C4-dicarboxylate transport system permease small subunit
LSNDRKTNPWNSFRAEKREELPDRPFATVLTWIFCLIVGAFLGVLGYLCVLRDIFEEEWEPVHYLYGLAVGAAIGILVMLRFLIQTEKRMKATSPRTDRDDE